jgi:L-amino acid N-acyltransferase
MTNGHDAKLIDCDESHKEAIRAILNESIENSTAVYDYHPRTLHEMDDWFAIKRRGKFPIIGLVNSHDQFMGFASYGSFRTRAGYKYTVEHSLYVAPEFRGQGLGAVLLAELIQRGISQDYHVLIGGIDSQNAASIQLHVRFGFKLTATMPQVGYKFGRWLDLLFYQLILQTPSSPTEE